MADTSSRVLAAQTDDGRTLFAVIDTRTRETEPQVSDMRLSAWLRPFADEASAHEALKAAGGSDFRECK